MSAVKHHHYLYSADADNERALAYGDDILYGVDVRSIAERHAWLTDAALNFAVNRIVAETAISIGGNGDEMLAMVPPLIPPAL